MKHNLLPGPAKAVRELLRSGEFVQCRGASSRGPIRGKETACILVVISIAAQRAGTREWGRWAIGTNYEPVVFNDTNAQVLNDRDGWTFEDFAAALDDV